MEPVGAWLEPVETWLDLWLYTVAALWLDAVAALWLDTVTALCPILCPQKHYKTNAICKSPPLTKTNKLINIVVNNNVV